MAYPTCVEDDAPEIVQTPEHDTSETPRNGLSYITNLAGAVVSIALIGGICVWGYKLMMRDVTGIPIVRAVEGEMRVLPADPGGELAEHQGLSVNVVAAEGGAEAPAERLVLAPQPVALAEEDVPIDRDAVAIVQQAIEDQTLTMTEDEGGDSVVVTPALVAKAAESGSVEELVAVLTENADPHGTDEGPEILIQAAAVASADIQSAVAAALADGPGLGASLRPKLRPNGLRETATLAAETKAAFAEIDPATLPAGTRLVQLGAYDTAEIARTEWDRFAGRFGDLMTGKERVVQEASSGGRAFYRLRAMGFEDLADARRFCAAIVADGADCIPVVTR
jgi:hypothetical protein